MTVILDKDFEGSKAKPYLLAIKDIRNKRAHDQGITAREAYRLADTV